MDGLLLEQAEARRVAASEQLPAENRRDLGQFFTPAPLARMLASFFDLAAVGRDGVTLLDPGAGTGSLTAAFVDRLTSEAPDLRLEAQAFELDPELHTPLKATLKECSETNANANTRLRVDDFIAWGAQNILLGEGLELFDFVIMNPPYRKISSASPQRKTLRLAHIEATNLYTAFLALAIRLLAPGGQLVAITPRSFCSGRYFREFRKDLLARTALKRIHVFQSRNVAFQDADVLQENIVFHLVRTSERPDIRVSMSNSHVDHVASEHVLPPSSVVRPDDPESFIHIAPSASDLTISERMHALRGSLTEDRLEVSTGRVVDFRSRSNLRALKEKGSAPLIYPGHLAERRVRWPEGAPRKPKAIAVNTSTESLLFPSGHYVLVKRFSSKEEPRRVVAAVYDPDEIEAERVAFENHLNVFHARGSGLPPAVAYGLAAFLNCSVVDAYFRLFSGHTQVNATDLRNIRYPTKDQLKALGEAMGGSIPDAAKLDELIVRYVPELAIP